MQNCDEVSAVLCPGSTNTNLLTFGIIHHFVHLEFIHMVFFQNLVLIIVAKYFNLERKIYY